MYYRKHIPEPRLKRCRRTLTVLALLFIFLMINAGVHSLVDSMLTAQARIIFNDAVNSAVQRAGESLETDDFVILTEDANGEITSVQTNSAAVNSYRAKLGELIGEELVQCNDEPVKIPIGSLTGIDILTGCGPGVSIRLVQKGSITADLVSSFSSAGINQTCHTINCIVEAEFYAVIPGFRTPVKLDTSVLIAQSVIVGAVPDSYTNVNGDQSDTIGRIFDYGDPYGDDVLSDE